MSVAFPHDSDLFEEYGRRSLVMTRHRDIDGDSCVCGAVLPIHASNSIVGADSYFPALLVVLSRRDSVPSTWAATLLTGSLVIAAMVQKYNQAITLHHATLILK